MKRISTKIRVWHILLSAMHDFMDARQKTGYILVNWQPIKCPDGYVPNWVFTSIQLCGSTSGLRYLRGGKNFLKDEHPEYDFQKKKIGRVWHYRIVKKQNHSEYEYPKFTPEPVDLKIRFEEVIIHPKDGMLQCDFNKYLEDSEIQLKKSKLHAEFTIEKPKQLKICKNNQHSKYDYGLEKYRGAIIQKKSKLKIRFAGSGV